MVELATQSCEMKVGGGGEGVHTRVVCIRAIDEDPRL